MKKLLMILPAMAFLVLGLFVPKISGDNKDVSMGVGSNAYVYDVKVDTFDELKEALLYDANTLITLDGDIEVTDMMTTGAANYTIVASKDVTLVRGAEFTERLIYVQKGSTLTIGQTSSTNKIVFDGNGENVVATDSVIGNHGTLNLYNGVAITNVNAAVNGAALYNKGTCSLDGVTINNNIIDEAGFYGIIYTTNDTHLYINNSEIYNNTATHTSGAAIFANANSCVWINNSNLHNNTSGTRGGTIAAKTCELIIKNSKFANNSADYGAAINGYNGANLTLTNVEFDSNNATSVGAAVSLLGSTLTAKNLSAHDNIAKNGGAIYVEPVEGYVTSLNINGGQYKDNIATKTSDRNGRGGAVYVKGAASVVSIVGATFTNNQACYGGAIRIDSAIATITNVTLAENKATDGATAGAGGALYIEEGSTTNIYSSQINNNEAVASAGALLISHGSNVEIFSTKISGNTSGNVGGGITLASGSYATINDAKVYSNTAVYGAGIRIEGDSHFVQESGEIMYNISSASGCAVFVEKGSYTLNDGQLSFNHTTGSNGGAINNKDRVYINGGTIQGNSGTYYGGAIHSYTGEQEPQVIINGGLFKDNGKVVTVDGESATLGEARNFGGGAININTGLLEINYAKFENNATKKSGSSDGFGAAIRAVGGKIIISNSVFTGNLAQSGGGAIYAKTAELEIYNCSFGENASTLTSANGGALFLDSLTKQAIINNSTFTKNTAKTYGGAIHMTNSDAEITNSTFKENSADGPSESSGAGAISSYISGVLTLNNCTFEANTATAESEGVRGEDLYVWGKSGAVNDAIAIINGGKFENLGVQYGRISFGGNVTISEKAMVWAGVKANYAHFIIHDELTNPIMLFNRWDFESGTKSLFLRINLESKKDPYRLLNNLIIKTPKAIYNASYDQAANVATMVKCTYSIFTPTPKVINSPIGATADTIVSFSVINGFNISNVKCNGTEITPDETGLYSFTMPSETVNITYDCQYEGMAILLDDEAKGLLDVQQTALLESTVCINLADSREWVVDRVYYQFNGENIYLENIQGKYYFTMFEGVKLFVEKTPLFKINFAQDDILSAESTIKFDGKVVVSALAGSLIDVNIVSGNYKYLPDLANSYYMIDGDSNHYSIETLQFEMPSANVTIYPAFINVYESFTNIVEVRTFEQLKNTLTTNVDADIILIENIEVNETINVAPYTKFNIVASGDKVIKRAAGFTKTMFYLPEFSIINLGLEEMPEDVDFSLTIDGNGSSVKNAAGSLFAVFNSSELIVNKSVTLTNNKLDINEFAGVERISEKAGGSAVVIYSGQLIVNGGEIVNNTSKGLGGAVYSHGYVEVNSGKINNNQTTTHGGAIYSNRMVLVNGGEISYNKATQGDANGGALFCASSFASILTINGGKFEGNTSYAGSGAIHVGARAAATINGGEFINNQTLTGRGGAIYLYGVVTINDAIFRGNKTKLDGGAIYVNSEKGSNISAQLNVYGGLFEENTAGDGGAIYVSNTKDTSLNSKLYIYGGVFNKNSAKNGGALAVMQNATLYMENSTATISNNTATTRGGALYLISGSDVNPSRAVILEGTFTNNKAAEGNDITVQYGVLEIGGSVNVNDLRTVANPTANRGYIKVIEDLENTIFVQPVAFDVESRTDQRFIRKASGVSADNVVEKLLIKQPGGTTYWLQYINGEFRLRRRTYLITLDGLQGAIKTMSNADKGEQITISVNNGYSVSDIKVNGQPLSGNSFTMPNQDVTIQYTATLVNYTVKVKEDIVGGQVSVDKQTATVADKVTITIASDSGYYITSLTVNGKSISIDAETIIIDINQNTTISATFEKAKYMVSYNYNYGGKIEIKTVVAGSVLKQITPERKGYTFEGWYIDKQLTVAYDFNSPVYSVVQLYAKWTQK